MEKLKIKTFPSQAELDYNSGKSTQVPTGLRIAVNKHVSRKISYNGRTITYEKYRAVNENKKQSFFLTTGLSFIFWYILNHKNQIR